MFTVLVDVQYLFLFSLISYLPENYIRPCWSKCALFLTTSNSKQRNRLFYQHFGKVSVETQFNIPQSASHSFKALREIPTEIDTKCKSNLKCFLWHEISTWHYKKFRVFRSPFIASVSQKILCFNSDNKGELSNHFAFWITNLLEMYGVLRYEMYSLFSILLS